MTPTFGDTSYYVAALNPRDELHDRAVGYFGDQPLRILTTEYVLIEVANFFAPARARGLFLRLIETIRADPDTVLIPGTSQWFTRGLDLFARRLDKDWSLTDCISFVVMAELGLTDALTADHHFAQAGFVPLLA